MARVVVVGGGVAGCAVAARLARLGHDVTVLELLERLGGAVGRLEVDGFAWDTGPTCTTLPAALRDLFAKTGRPLEHELDLVPAERPREHRFEDGTPLDMPTGAVAPQRRAVDAALGEGAGAAWVAYARSHAGEWDLLRRNALERPWDPDRAEPAALRLLRDRTTLERRVRRALRGHDRLREVALLPARLGGHRPRDVPGWAGVEHYLEQTFGTWTVPGGMGLLAGALARRLAERGVGVETGVRVRDLALRAGRVTGVRTDRGDLDADHVVVAVDPGGLPALAGQVRDIVPAGPPVVTHLGLSPGHLPDRWSLAGAGHPTAMPAEVVLHGDPLLVVRTTGTSPTDDGAAWTVLGHRRPREDVLVTLARRGLDVRERVATRVDGPTGPRALAGGRSAHGVLWRGRGTVRDRLGTTTPVPGAWCVGEHAAGIAGLPGALLTAALVADQLDRAPRDRRGPGPSHPSDHSNPGRPAADGLRP